MLDPETYVKAIPAAASKPVPVISNILPRSEQSGEIVKNLKMGVGVGVPDLRIDGGVGVGVGNGGGDIFTSTRYSPDIKIVPDAPSVGSRPHRKSISELGVVGFISQSTDFPSS